ncbi:hypothetical protein EDD65_101257 [Keratinibaculum paraultunense]|uniref:SLH domain-containing protein n=1 Tax=Keratinibaculum paraultunense TaxID=1278232 RepID=A0A4R3KZY5_9FIRM|nr:hypothetical protein [Keratinibaculum paraultunense]QQY79929.1 hypothetical protein JL105_00925 [Keratinibaculum paraultunense]TCS91752.1 hypothetical protein EDD65_101257 [Keratinibaculum paraultunense]
MKRKLSLLLAVVMILGSFSMAFAAEEEVNPAKFLEKEGILVGNESGDLMLDEPLLRRDAVVILSRLMKAEDEAKNFKEEGLPTFKDITDKYYTPYLAWAQSNKYIKGHTEEKFGFNDNLTTKEFAAVLLRALGYLEEADDWEELFIKAKDLGILEGVEKEADTKLVRREVAQMIYNALGVKMKDSDKTLAEFLGIEMPEPSVLEIEEVKAENLKEITVVLSNAKLVKNEIAIEDADNYRTNAGKVVDVRLIDNELRLLLDGEMKQGKKYDLSIKDVQKELDGKYEFVAYDNEAPKVEEVRVLGTQGIRVTMSEPVKNPHEKDFRLDGKNFVMRVRNYGRDITLIPYRENGKFEEGEHELTVGQLTDYAGFKSKEEKFDINIVEDTTKPVVKRIIAKNNSVVVEFEQEVHPDSINKTNVSWTQVRGRKATEADGYEILSGNRVKYTFGKAKELPKPEVEITVKGVKNYSGYEMDPHTEVVPLTLDFSRPEIVDWKLLDDDVMKLVFSKDLDKKTVEDTSNYVLNKYNESKETYEEIRYAVKSAKLGDANNIVLIEFSEPFVQGGKYRLDVSGLRDDTTLRNSMIDDEIFFTYGIGENLDVTAVVKRDKEQIILLFNKDLVRREAEELRNYEFRVDNKDGKLLRAEDLSREPSVILYGDGRTVEINLPGNERDIHSVVLGLNITSLDGNRMEDREVVLKESRLSITSAVLSKDGKTITVSFNQEITKAPEKDEVTLEGAEKASDFKVDVVRGKLEITGFTGVPTKVEIKAGSSIESKYENGSITKKAMSKNITDERALDAEIEAKLDADNELTIKVTLNKTITASQEDKIDVLVDGNLIGTLGSFTRAGKEYTLELSNQAGAKKVRVVGEGLDETVEVGPAVPPAPVEPKISSAKIVTAGQDYEAGVQAVQAELTIDTTTTTLDNNTNIEITSIEGSKSISDTIDISDVLDDNDPTKIDLNKLATAIDNLGLDITAEVVTDTSGTNLVLKGSEDGTNNIKFEQSTTSLTTVNGTNGTEGKPAVPEKQLIQQEIEFGFTAVPGMLEIGQKVTINGTSSGVTGEIKSIDRTNKTVVVKLDKDLNDSTKVQKLAVGDTINSFEVTTEGSITVTIPFATATGVTLQ